MPVNVPTTTSLGRPMHDYTEEGSGEYARRDSASSIASSILDEKSIETRLLGWVETQGTHNDMERMLESQTGAETITPATPPEYQVPLLKKLIFLGLYFFLNISLTLSNKDLLLEVSHRNQGINVAALTVQKIRAPWMLTMVHATATSLGCWILVLMGRLKLSTVSGKDHIILMAFSSLFTLNIAASNVSL